jgi:heat shock protein HspQ
VLLIPHYLGDTEFPAAALSALESTSASTGLIFPTDRLREANREFVARIDDQVQSNPELAKLVGTLEQRYDAYMEGSQLRSPLTDEDGELPSADEIAAELENFLALRRSRDDGDVS